MEDLDKNITKITTPNTSGIYALWKDGKIMYIGGTTNIRKRIAHHEYTKKGLIIDFDAFSYISIDDYFFLNDSSSLEAEYILKYSPPWNRIIHSNSTWFSFNWIRQTYFKGRVHALRDTLYKNNIEPNYVFRSIPYYHVDKIKIIAEDSI